MYYDYGAYTLDITGPLMICTQKVTSLAFSAYDGVFRVRKKERLSDDQRLMAINKLPSFLEFFSYIFSFHGILLGPMCFYRDYAVFVEGKQYTQKTESSDVIKIEKEPSPNRVVVKNVILAFTCIGITMSLASWYPKTLMVDENFVINHNFVYRTLICILVVFLARSKYYFGWKLGEATNNAAGLGFNGYDEKNNAKWNLIENVNIPAIEFATSFRDIINNWNIQTAIWLRRICYDRLKGVYRTYATYTLSAIWHGFYPGYYFTFLGGALTTNAARTLRRIIRPLMLSPPWLKKSYDVVTWFFSHLALAYFIVPFTLLDMKRVYYFYTYNQYWWMHLVVIGILLLPFVWKPKIEAKSEKVKKHND
ncbi:DgyrCDS3779 [Dimorphilus gyrociliatus]|uniref:DgyrCDS3779 n=1 Tax=Dimorphilus gyrociliatus TaxID=2664684 RepID=A0A7I8VHJ7_9ANNE|nr:DgyrCDS3779 [Dimorphilus gyrociliatus]